MRRRPCSRSAADGERLAAHRLGDPHGTEPQLVQLGHVFDGLARRNEVEVEGPDAVRADVHVGTLSERNLVF